MAKENKKTITLKKNSIKSQDDEDEEEEETNSLVNTQGVEDIEDGDEEETAAPAQVQVQAAPSSPQKAETAKVSKADLVTVVMLEEVNPAPTIGHPSRGGYSFVERGIQKLEARKNYLVPLRVARVLVDRKKASMIG